MKIAYFILAHHKPNQLIRLLRAIHSPENIYLIHVDLKAKDEMFEIMKLISSNWSNVYTLPSRPLIWGGWSLVQVEIDAIRVLLKDPGWTHYINLSGQDFPLINQEEIQQRIDFNISYLDYHQDFHLNKAYTGKYYVEDCGQIKVLGDREPFTDYFLPEIEPYRASQWKILSRQAAQYSVDSPMAYQLQDYFRVSLMSDESYFPTVLLNSDIEKQIRNNNYRFLNMKVTNEGFYRPDILTEAYLPHLNSTDAFFARKFDDEIDNGIISILENRVLNGISKDQEFKFF
ncbi:hypothetical protein G9G63_09585 [Paenibacillus sp. EKM202P]|uniref:beta-1,6-N-acetylglucosaminyltransferase n=1 Tax=unclassified Paenibacillus TaxID=185978 RepID=UPI0013EBF688|nr:MULTISPECIES: beta-1,6-N-acetylglucosaminyltransferase [unclassified Paenibacillus]KAF6565399.1 hypothetical protein G9G63_09585 [Paenibacillus sp. EKM202P]KAF6569276.1 hypothetical protein G9G64_12510 [Paenibacillus sp. EKM207P]